MELSEIKSLKSKYAGFVFAGIACALLYGWFCFVVRFGIGREDTASVLVLAQRLVQGDRFFVDDWHFSQLIGLVMVVPYAAYVYFAGSTEGILLFTRYFYLAGSFLTYWYIISKMRKISMLKAVVCAVLFCGFVPYALFAPNSYNVPLLLCLIVYFIFTEKRGKHHALKLLCSGCLFSAAVLASPSFALIYFIYSISVFICFLLKKRNKNILCSYQFVLDVKVWLYFSIGILFSAVLFLFYLQFTSGWEHIIDSFPNLFGSSIYDFSAGGNAWHFLPERLHRAYYQFHPVSFISASVLFIGAIIYRKTKTKIFRLKYLLFLLLHIVFVVACVCAVSSKFESIEGWNYWFYHSDLYVPVFVFCCICCMLCDRRNENAVFCLITSSLLSLLKDAFSDATFGMGYVLSVFALVDIYPQAVTEIKLQLSKEKKAGKKSVQNALKKEKLLKTAVIAIGVFFCFWSMLNIATQTEYIVCEYDEQGKIETPDQDAIAYGPYKGIITSQRVKNKYLESISDMDTIISLTEEKIYITMNVPYCDLYVGRPYASYAVWVNAEDLQSRLIRYWTLYPDRRPGIIYVPDFDFDFYQTDYGMKVFNILENCFLYDSIDGAAGKIIQIRSWKI